MKKVFCKLVFSAWMLVGLLAMVQAQDMTFALAENSSFVVEGTSTLHSWKVTANKADAKMIADKGFSGKNLPAAGSVIKSLEFKVPIAEMKGRATAMDEKMAKALKAETHPNIIYTLSEAKVEKVDAAQGTFVINSKGKLTVAGVSKDATFQVTGKKLPDGTYQFEGAHPMKMTDFQVEPPTAMFGQIVSGDEVKFVFNLKMKPAK